MAAYIYLAQLHVRDVAEVGGTSLRFSSGRRAKGYIKCSPGFGLVVTDLLLPNGVRNTHSKFAGSVMFGQVIRVFLEVRINFSQTDESALNSKRNIISERCLLHLIRHNHGQNGMMRDGW